jgi:serine protease AprX
MYQKFLVIALAAAGAAHAQIGQRSVVPDRAEAGFAEENVDVIVKFRDDGVAFSRRHGLNPRFNHKIIRSHAYTLRRTELERLRQDPDIEFIAPDQTVGVMLDLSRGAVQADVASGWSGAYGTNITVAVVDSGLSATKDSVSPARILYEKSFLPNKPSTADEYGHGTHVSSIIGGEGAGTKPAALYRGLAPGAKLINLRVLDKNGQGKDSYVIDALNWVVANKSKYDIRVVNLSLGRPVSSSYKTDPLCLAVEAVWKAGIVVVVAAGNDGRNNQANTQGYGTVGSPANDPYVITVGAAKAGGTLTRTDDMPASYSSKGPTMVDHIVKPDLLAPGNRVVALGAGQLYSDFPSNVVDSKNKYMRLSGTSMAAPVVTGAVAMLLGADSSLTPDQVKARLMKNAWRGFAPQASVVDGGNTYTVRSDIFTVGAGYLDISAALADWAYRPGKAALSPVAAYNATTQKVTLVGASNVIWGDITTPLNVIWGTNILTGTNVIWGDNVIWGTTTSATNVIWGDKAIGSNSSNVDGEAVKLLLDGEN